MVTDRPDPGLLPASCGWVVLLLPPQALRGALDGVGLSQHHQQQARGAAVALQQALDQHELFAPSAATQLLPGQGSGGGKRRQWRGLGEGHGGDVATSAAMTASLQRTRQLMAQEVDRITHAMGLIGETDRQTDSREGGREEAAEGGGVWHHVVVLANPNRGGRRDAHGDVRGPSRAELHPAPGGRTATEAQGQTDSTGHTHLSTTSQPAREGPLSDRGVVA